MITKIAKEPIFYRLCFAIGVSLLLVWSVSGCSKDADSVTGEWYSLDNPDASYFSLKSDGTVEVFDKDDYAKGEYTIEENRLCMDFGAMQSGCGTIVTYEGIKVVDVGNIFAYGKENAVKLHEEGITEEDIERDSAEK